MRKSRHNSSIVEFQQKRGGKSAAFFLEFDREARNISHAIASAIENVETAGAKVERVEPDYLVSLAEIAERSGLTRAAISLYASGGRGKDFPAPVARVSSGSPLWNWVDVARWLRKRAQISTDTAVESRVVKRANDNIQAVRQREYA